MRNIKLTLQYIGTQYCGWQIQPNGPTLQAILQESLQEILQEKVTLISAGRTDSGVHAMAQVAHFKTQNLLEPAILQKALNGKLPFDISVLSVQEVPESFHALKDAISKTYTYLLFNSARKFPLLEAYSWRVYGRLDLDSMHRCLEMLVGEHNFRAFCAADSTAKTFVRRLNSVSLQPLTLQDFGKGLLGMMGLGGMVAAPEMEESLIAISFKGQGFLKHMIRNIVGTLVDVGRGKTDAEEFKRIFASQDRTQAGKTAPARGLFMVQVEYP